MRSKDNHPVLTGKRFAVLIRCALQKFNKYIRNGLVTMLRHILASMIDKSKPTQKYAFPGPSPVDVHGKLLPLDEYCDALLGL
jgi:hypothetical protein